MNELQQFASNVHALSMRDKVNVIEHEIKKVENLNGLVLTHYFSDGVYGRELFIPRDTIIVGKIHKYDNLNILVYGEMSVLVDEQIVRVRSPFTTVSPAGTKRIAYTHTDCIWITILRTDELDTDRIEDHFTAQSEQEYLEFVTQQFKLPLQG